MKGENFYQVRINKAVDYIDKHLHENINISKSAEQCHFSLFHFQRIYKALQAETPYETLLRLRLEKATYLLRYHKEMKIIDVSLNCGFNSVENFSRQFKSRFQLTASEYRNNKKLHNSKIHQESSFEVVYDSESINNKKFKVTIEKLQAIPIVFIRAIFGKDGSILVQQYKKLIQWADDHDIHYQNELSRFGMSIDNPYVTPRNKFRYDFAIANTGLIPEDGIFECGEIPKANYATIHVKGDLQKVAQAWNYLYDQWLPNSSYIPIHYPAIEEFIQGPEQIGWDQFNIKCRIPLKQQE